jgi:hypothetical protein
MNLVVQPDGAPESPAKDGNAGRMYNLHSSLRHSGTFARHHRRFPIRNQMADRTSCGRLRNVTHGVWRCTFVTIVTSFSQYRHLASLG